MKETCLLYLSIFPGFIFCLTAMLVAVYPPRPDTTQPRPPLFARVSAAGIAALAAAFFLTLAAAAGESIVTAMSERALVGRSLAGEQPEDGRRIAASGTLVAEGAVLRAPFSGTPCVAYQNKIQHTSRGSSSTTTTDCWGYMFAPSHVETTAGVVRVLGCTDSDFGPPVFTGQESRERARIYFATTRFVTTGLRAISSAWKALKGVMADDDGSIKTDFGPPPEDLHNSKHTFQELVVCGREQACAFGTFSAARSGLVPVTGSREITQVRIMKGTAGAVRRRLLRRAGGQIALAAVLTAAGVVIVVALIHLAPSFT